MADSDRIIFICEFLGLAILTIVAYLLTRKR